MKNLILCFVLCAFSTSSNSQELMTIGEVFDYEVGDIFQISANNPEQPPSADRITIIDKFFTNGGKTVNYVRYHDSYYTHVIWDTEPYLEYNFWTETDTIQYSNLDSSLIYFDIGFNYDTSIYLNMDYCDSLINKCEYEIGTFEPDCYRNLYGRGLGLVETYLFQGGGPAIAYDISMFYYKKNGNDCGIPDNTTVGVDTYELNNLFFSIMPNLACREINIINHSNALQVKYKIFDLSGRCLITRSSSGEITSINIDDLKRGIYCAMVEYDGKIATMNFVKN